MPIFKTTVDFTPRMRLEVEADIGADWTTLLHVSLEGDKSRENLLGFISHVEQFKLAAMALDAQLLAGEAA